MNSIARKLLATLLTVIAFGFFLASASHSVLAQDLSSSPVPQCPVCHNGHTIYIPCNQVNKYLQKHPGDYAGMCQGVTQEKP